MGPQPLANMECYAQETQSSAIACRKNLVWTISRQIDPTNQPVPSWTGFNVTTRNQEPISQDIIGYLPTINSPATELTTVFEILNQSEIIRKELHLETIVVVLDQALYAKATEIAWKHKQRFTNILLRMGTFHTICNILAILGKRFGDAGLKDIFIEAGIVAEGSIKGVFDGKHYNHAVRAHKYIYEALMRLAWAELTPSVEDNFPEKSEIIKSFLDHIKDMISNLNQTNFNNLVQNPRMAEMMALWTDFLEHLRKHNGELFAFWMSYVDIVENV